MKRGLRSENRPENIRAWLESVNWSCAEGAAVAGCKTTTMQKTVRGEAYIGKAAWRRLRLAIGLIHARSDAHRREVARKKYSMAWRHEKQGKLAAAQGRTLPKRETLGKLHP